MTTRCASRGVLFRTLAGGALASAVPALAVSAQLHPAVSARSTMALLSAAGGEPAPPGDADRRELIAVALLERIAERYAAAATHERIAVKYAGPDGRERFDQLQFSMDPGVGGQPRLAVSMGAIRLRVAEGLVTAVSESAVGRMFRAALGEEVTAEAMSRVIPPLPIPALEFMTPGAKAPSSMTPYARGIVWESLAELDAANRTWAVLRGAAGDVRVALTVDLTTWRIRHLKILGGRPDAGWSLECAVTPLAAPERDLFEPIDGPVSDVASLAELVASQVPLMAGDMAPGLTLMNAELRGWSLPDAFAGGGDDRLAVLVLHRGRPSGTMPVGSTPQAASSPGDVSTLPLAEHAAARDARAALKSARTVARQLGRNAAAHPVEVLALNELRVAGVETSAALWSDASLLVSTAGRSLLDRFAPGHDAVVLVVGSDHIIRGVIPADGQADDQSAMIRALREAMAP